jgi:hypothetical protein
VAEAAGCRIVAGLGAAASTAGAGRFPPAPSAGTVGIARVCADEGVVDDPEEPDGEVATFGTSRSTSVAAPVRSLPPEAGPGTWSG